jgi:hypothetical protein
MKNHDLSTDLDHFVLSKTTAARDNAQVGRLSSVRVARDRVNSALACIRSSFDFLAEIKRPMPGGRSSTLITPFDRGGGDSLQTVASRRRTGAVLVS